MPDDEPDTDRIEAEMEAMALWEHHLEEATRRWQEGVQRSAEEYREGYAEAMGVDPEDVPDEAVEHWQEGVMETGPEAFAGAVAGEGADWFVGLYERATGKEPSEEVRSLAREVEREALSEVGEDATDEEVLDAVREVVRRRRGGG